MVKKFWNLTHFRAFKPIFAFSSSNRKRKFLPPYSLSPPLRPALDIDIPGDTTSWSQICKKFCRRRLSRSLQRLKVRNLCKKVQWLWFINHNFWTTFQNDCNSTRRKPGLGKNKWGTFGLGLAECAEVTEAFYMQIMVYKLHKPIKNIWFISTSTYLIYKVISIVNCG